MRLPSCLLPAVLLVTPTFSWGQAEFYDAYLVATYDGSAMQLLLSLGHRNMGPGTCRGNAVGFDVFRRTLGYECGSEKRLTDEPIPWPVTGNPGFEVSFADPDVAPNTAYRYEARPVDAERNPAEGALVTSVWGYGVVGVALLAHGQLVLGDNFNVIVGTCPDECFPACLLTGISVSDEQLESTVELYGNGVNVESYSNQWNPQLYCTSISPAPCPLAVEHVGWSALKVLYK